MVRSTTPTTCKDMSNGRIIEYRYSFYWVPDDVDDRELRRGDDLEHDPNTGEFVELDKFGSQEQAEAWARLQELGPSYEDRPVPSPEVTATHARDEKIPVVVAKEGKAKIAAYLYALNHSELSISNALDVSERTVGQYLSDVRRGER